jgi:hypothetical protein
MNMTNPKHVSDSTTQIGQDHVATGVLLVLGTNTHRNLLENQTTLNKPFHKYHQAHIAIWRATGPRSNTREETEQSESKLSSQVRDSATNLQRLHNLQSFHLSFGDSTTYRESATKFWRLHNFRRLQNF